MTNERMTMFRRTTPSSFVIRHWDLFRHSEIRHSGIIAIVATVKPFLYTRSHKRRLQSNLRCPMPRVRFLMIGGFLGAGKTTAIARLARYYIDQGLSVGLVTNDQANDLVDTESLRAQGFNVGEVTGACFCCKFNGLLDTVSQISEGKQPDIILAEPVGSCTDLVSTVVEPLRRFYGERFEVAPLAVLLKPEHGRKILADDASFGFSPKAAYIFLKQLEEADIVVINKIDKLSAADRETMLQLVRDRYPTKTIVAASSKTGEGLAVLLDELQRPSRA